MAHSQSWTTHTATTWTPDADVIEITVYVTGGGGGGGGSAGTTFGGGGGGGGAYSYKVYTNPTGSHTVHCGEGGTGAAHAGGTVGGDSYFYKTSNNECFAQGGKEIGRAHV